MARPCKPTTIKELSGNPGKRALNKSEPRPLGAPIAPTGMTATAKKVWARVIVSMPAGVFTNADSAILWAYCEAVAGFETAVKMAAKQTAEIKGSMGQAKVNPWFAEQRAWSGEIAKLGAKLGLDPVSRQNINTEGADSDDGFADLIQ